MSLKRYRLRAKRLKIIIKPRHYGLVEVKGIRFMLSKKGMRKMKRIGSNMYSYRNSDTAQFVYIPPADGQPLMINVPNPKGWSMTPVAPVITNDSWIVNARN